MPKYWLRNGSLSCWRGCSVVITEAGVGRLVDRERSSGYELGGKRGKASSDARRQLRIRPLQCAPARGFITTHRAALGKWRRIFDVGRGARGGAQAARSDGGASGRGIGRRHLAQAASATR